jgi:hypothetical protein
LCSLFQLFERTESPARKIRSGVFSCFLHPPIVTVTVQPGGGISRLAGMPRALFSGTSGFGAALGPFGRFRAFLAQNADAQ